VSGLTLNARMLGEFQLHYGDASLTGALTPRLQSLLAYLLLHRETALSRQQLAFQFWSESSEPQARTNLRKALHRLRQVVPALEQFVDLEGPALSWRSEAPLCLDVAELERGLDAAEAAPLPEQPALLAAALALYKDKLLPDLYDDWVLASRDRLHQRCLDAMEQLAELQEAQRDYGAATQAARRLLREDPLRERSYRRLMRLQALGGDVATALHTYHQCAALLEQELGVAPSPATQAAYRQLLQKQAQPAGAPAAPRQIPLLGRGAAWQALLASWRAVARGGRSQAAIISGEAGIGKTRLAEELLVWAGRQGITCLSAACFATEADMPLAPVAGWLRAQPVQAALASLRPRWRGEVARLLPELLAADPTLPAPPPVSDAWQKQQLFTALAETVGAAGSPLLLFLDDLHWADANTLSWLHFLARQEAVSRFLLVTTIRSAELAGNPSLLTWQHELERTLAIERIELDRLVPEATAALAAHLLRAELDGAAAEALYQATEGNPLFTVEMAHAGLDKSGSELPHKIRSVIDAHLDTLGPAARELVGLAALIGRSFSFPLLAAASPEPDAVVVRGLDELWQRQIVRERATSGDTYDFSHDLIRQVTLAQLSAARRCWGHERVAAALESIYAANLDAFHGQIAAHWEGAGQADRASDYYAKAAVVATHLYAHEEAVRQLQHALALLPATDQRRPDLLTRLGEAQILLSRYEAAATAFNEAATETADPVASARLLGRRAVALTGSHQFAEAEAVCREAMALLETIPTAARDETAWRIWLGLQFSLLDVLYFAHRGEEMPAIIEQMEGPLEAYGTARQRSDYYHFQAKHLLLASRIRLAEESVRLLEISLFWAEKSGDRAMVAQQTFGLGFTLLWAGRLAAATERLQQAAAQFDELGIVPMQSRTLTYLGIAYRMLGDEARVRQILEQDAVVVADADAYYLGVAEAQRAWLAWRTGDRAAADQYAQCALAHWGALDQATYPVQWLARLPMLASALESGEIAAARTQAEILLNSYLQRLASPVEDALQAAVAAESVPAVEAHLKEACDQAREHGYL
jgi:DNA-binding SARP family transcriptional activator